MLTTQTDDKKICGKCKVEKSLDHFSRVSPKAKSYKQFKNGIRPWCKECTKSYNKSYMAEKRKTDVRYQHYFRKYGLTKDQVHQMHEAQEFKCKICGGESDHRYDKLCVDHCHTTGKVRGLLCFSCNVMIGQAKDDVIRLAKAIEYLENS
jgi:hypothetical protein